MTVLQVKIEESVLPLGHVVAALLHLKELLDDELSLHKSLYAEVLV
jgi:hypothetical protein